MNEDKMEDLNNLISKLNKKSTEKEIIDILKVVSSKSPIEKGKLVKQISEKTDIGIRDIKNELKIINKKKHSLLLQNKANLVDIKYRTKEVLIYGKSKVYNTDDGIKLISEEGDELPITNFKLKILSYTIDKKEEERWLYTFIAGTHLFYNYPLENFLNLYSDRIFQRNIGGTIIKYIFSESVKNLKPIKGTYHMGFNNGWVLPIRECPNNLSIICYTDEQRNVLNNCRNMYKKYDQKEKDEIKKDLKEFIDRNQIPPDYLTIIIAHCIIAPFKLYFIKNFGVFPSLILGGKTTGGKTSTVDFFGNHFYGHYDEHMSGSTASSPARLEDTLTASTFPRVIDELSNPKFEIVDMIKESATSISDYKRKLSAESQFTRPKVTPLIITSNDIGSYFKDPANSARAIVLDFETVIFRDPRWIELNNKLENMKLFSLVYDYTRDWTNKDVADFISEAVGEKPTLKEKSKWEKEIPQTSVSKRHPKLEKEYPRIMETSKIILTGAYLVEKVFDYKLNTSKTLNTLLGSRRIILEDLIDRFYIFCEAAIEFDPNKSDSRAHGYLTNQLESKMIGKGDIKEKMHIFTQKNLRDFNTYNQNLEGRKYSLRGLGNLIQNGLEDKSLVKWTNVNFKSKDMKVIRINKDFISGRFCRTSENKKIQETLKIDEKDEEELRNEMFRTAKEEAERIEKQKLKYDLEYREEMEEYKRKEELDKIVWEEQKKRMKIKEK